MEVGTSVAQDVVSLFGALIVGQSHRLTTFVYYPFVDPVNKNGGPIFVFKWFMRAGVKLTGARDPSMGPVSMGRNPVIILGFNSFSVIILLYKYV